MNDKDLIPLFHYLSKLTIVIPLVIIVAALFFRFNHQEVLPSVKDKEQVTATPKINLNGPLVCGLATNTASYSGYIKNKNIFAKVSQKEKTESYLVKDDCLYQWTNMSHAGKKYCGISQVLTTVEFMAGFDLLEVENLAKYLPIGTEGEGISTKEADIKKIIDSCKKQEVKDDIFLMPANIVFKDEKPWLRPTFPISALE